MRALGPPRSSSLASRSAQSAREALDAALRPNSRRAYGRAWSEWFKWCEARRVTPAPPSQEALIAYLPALPSEAQLNQTLAVLQWRERTAGRELQIGPHLRLVLKGRRKQLKEKSIKQAPAMTLPELRKVLSKIDQTDPIGIRDTAILLVGWWGALRRGEIAGLWLEDVHAAPYGLEVDLLGEQRRGTKTGSKREPDKLRLMLRRKAQGGMADPLCPVTAYRKWLEYRPDSRLGADSDTRVFRLSGEAINEIVAARCKAVGLHKFTGHSLRAGFATEALSQGIPDSAVMEVTRHRNVNMLLRYKRPSKDAVPLAASRLKT